MQSWFPRNELTSPPGHPNRQEKQRQRLPVTEDGLKTPQKGNQNRTRSPAGVKQLAAGGADALNWQGGMTFTTASPRIGGCAAPHLGGGFR